MKKTIKALALLFIAAMFMGCNGLGKVNDLLEEANEFIEEPLFDESDCKNDATKIKFSTGKWILRGYSKGKSGSAAIEYIFSIKNDSSTVTGVNFDSNKECILKVSEDGDCSVYTDDQFDEFETNSKEFAAAIAMSLLRYGSTEMDIEYQGLKTNSGNTKYYWKKIADNGDVTKYYLKKL